MGDHRKKREYLTVEQAISRNRGLLYYIIRPIVGDENLVDDCFSTVTEIIIKNYDKYDSRRGTLTAWLTRLTRNAALSFVQNKKYAMTAGTAEDMAEAEAAADRKTPEDHLIEKENLAELKEALSRIRHFISTMES